MPDRTQLRNQMIQAACIFCGATIGERVGVCGNGEPACIFCRQRESHAANPCITEHHSHVWRRGHDFQRVPVRG